MILKDENGKEYEFMCKTELFNDGDGYSIVREIKPKPLKCSGGMFSVGIDGKTSYSSGDNTLKKRIGNAYESLKEAKRASDRRVPLEIINRHAIELNKKDGFVADFTDIGTTKYFLLYCNHFNKWVMRGDVTSQQLGVVYMSVGSAKYLCEKLNAGLIQGVDKHWEDS